VEHQGRVCVIPLEAEVNRLSNREAIKVATFVAQDMQNTLRRFDSMGDLISPTFTDDRAVSILKYAFPEFSDAFDGASTTADVSERGELARNLLLVLIEQGHEDEIRQAVKQLQFVADPLTWMAVGASIVFLLSIKFKVRSKIIDGQRRIEWDLSREATPIEIVAKILQVSISDSRATSKQRDSEE
jgi:hypothetical protein